VPVVRFDFGFPPRARVVRSKASRRAAALVIASAAAMLAAACGGGSGTATTTGGGSGTSGGGGGNNAAFTAYTECLKKNGVTITLPSGGARVRPSGEPRPSGQPRPSGSAGARRLPGGGGFFGKPDGVDDATWQKAQAACASVRPSFGPGGGGRTGGAFQAYTNCLRSHGVQMGQGQQLNSADPTVKKALDTCKVLRPTGQPTPSS